MIINITRIFNRINEINSKVNSLKDYKPEPVQNFQNALQEAMNKNNIQQKTVKAATVPEKVQNEKKHVINIKLDDIVPEKRTVQKTSIPKQNIKLPDRNIESYKKIVSERIENAINKAVQKYDLPAKLLAAVIKVESNFDPYAVSPKGAMGLMQLMPRTADFLGVKNPYNIEENILGGAKYLKGLLDKYKQNIDLALSAYNAGERAVDRAQGIPNINETINYVSKIKDILF